MQEVVKCLVKVTIITLVYMFCLKTKQAVKHCFTACCFPTFDLCAVLFAKRFGRTSDPVIKVVVRYILLFNLYLSNNLESA